MKMTHITGTIETTFTTEQGATSTISTSGFTIAATGQPSAFGINAGIASNILFLPESSVFTSTQNADILSEHNVLVAGENLFAFGGLEYSNPFDVLRGEDLFGANITDTAKIFQVGNSTTEIAEGDSFIITNTTTNTLTTFTFKQVSPNTSNGEFNSIDTLTTAINSAEGLLARFGESYRPDIITAVGGFSTSVSPEPIMRIAISAADASHGLTFSNGTSNNPETNVAGELGFFDILEGADRGRISSISTGDSVVKWWNTLDGLAAAIDKEDGLSASTSNNSAGGAITISAFVSNPVEGLLDLKTTSKIDFPYFELSEIFSRESELYDADNSSKNIAGGSITPSFFHDFKITDKFENTHDVRLAFAVASDNRFAVELFVTDTEEITSLRTTAGLIANGEVKINSDGTLSSVSSGLTKPFDIFWSNGLVSEDISFDFGTPTSPDSNITNVGIAGVTLVEENSSDEGGITLNSSDKSSITLSATGEAFLILNSAAERGEGDFFYIKSDYFTVDDNGYLVDQDGLYLYSYPLDGIGRLPGTTGNVNTTSSQLLESLRAVNIAKTASERRIEEDVENEKWDFGFFGQAREDEIAARLENAAKIPVESVLIKEDGTFTLDLEGELTHDAHMLSLATFPRFIAEQKDVLHLLDGQLVSSKVLDDNDLFFSLHTIEGLDFDQSLFAPDRAPFSVFDPELHERIGDIVRIGGITSTHNNIINGKDTDDVFRGNVGTDSIRAGAGNDNINGNQDNDSVFGDSGTDTVRGGKNDDFVNGNQDNDEVFGDKGNDTVHGGKGDDIVNGGDGFDRIFGDLGNDTLTGGEGIDLFIFHANSGLDTVTDFTQGTDLIHLASSIYTTGAEAVAAFSDGVLDLGDGNTVTLTGIETLLVGDIGILI